MKLTPEQYSHILESIRVLSPKLEAYRELITDNPRAASLPSYIREDAAYTALGGAAFREMRAGSPRSFDASLRRAMIDLGFPEFSK